MRHWLEDNSKRLQREKKRGTRSEAANVKLLLMMMLQEYKMNVHHHNYHHHRSSVTSQANLVLLLLLAINQSSTCCTSVRTTTSATLLLLPVTTAHNRSNYRYELIWLDGIFHRISPFPLLLRRQLQQHPCRHVLCALSLLSPERTNLQVPFFSPVISRVLAANNTANATTDFGWQRIGNIGKADKSTAIWMQSLCLLQQWSLGNR